MTMGPTRLVVAIDFGTTYSGIAYCFPEKLPTGNLRGIQTWPGSIGADKIPTVVKYDSANPGHFEWGAPVESSRHNIIGIKLLLDPDQTLPWHVPQTDIETTLKLLPPSKSPKDVATDFLRAIKTYGISHIQTQVAKTNLDAFDIEYVMSVPAVWSDAAKNATLEAAEFAGISPVTLVKEPEAAALYSLRRLQAFVEPHDVMVICDAGGGTVDLISYEIEATTPNLQLKEIVPGTGAMVGSMVLNRRFRAAVKDLIPDNKWESLKHGRAVTNVCEYFENQIKKGFAGDLKKRYVLDFFGTGLEDDPDHGFKDQEWRITGADIKVIFDPVVTDILRLIRGQVQSVERKRKAVRSIILVGGFGGNEYLRSEVARANPGITVVPLDDAWAAIAKGAALSKMPSQAVVTGVAAVRHYGVQALADFDSSIDQGQPTVYDACTGLYKVSRMSWFINIGDNIQKDRKIRLPFLRVLPENFQSGPTMLQETLFECDEGVAPVHPSTSQAINANCVLHYDIGKFPATNFKKMFKWSGNSLLTQGLFGCATDLILGESYWQVSYDLVISFDSAVMTFSLEVDGQTFGSVQAEFGQQIW